MFGYQGVTTYMIENEVVRKLSVNDKGENVYDKLMAFMSNNNITEEEFYFYLKGLDEDSLLEKIADSGGYDSVTEYAEVVAETLLTYVEEIQNLFLEKTDIEIWISHHNSDYEGSRYDMVDGLFFEANFDDIYMPTPALRLFEDNGFNAERISFVKQT